MHGSVDLVFQIVISFFLSNIESLNQISACLDRKSSTNFKCPLWAAYTYLLKAIQFQNWHEILYLPLNFEFQKHFVSEIPWEIMIMKKKSLGNDLCSTSFYENNLNTNILKLCTIILFIDIKIKLLYWNHYMLFSCIFQSYI